MTGIPGHHPGHHPGQHQPPPNFTPFRHLGVGAVPSSPPVIPSSSSLPGTVHFFPHPHDAVPSTSSGRGGGGGEGCVGPQPAGGAQGQIVATKARLSAQRSNVQHQQGNNPMNKSPMSLHQIKITVARQFMRFKGPWPLTQRVLRALYS